MSRPLNAIDFWRGFALVTIFVNHIPGVFYDRFTPRNFWISDSAELFVFLAGWSLRVAVGKPENPTPTGEIMSRLGGRIVNLYAAHIMIVTIAIALLAAAATLLDNPLLLEWNNAAAVFHDPINAHIGLVLLSYQLGYFDILPLYVALMMIAPLIVLIHRSAPGALFPLSLTIYLVTLIWQIDVPSWPTSGTWFFNPLAWQMVFVLGFLMARERGIGGYVRTHIERVRLLAALLVVVGLIVHIYGLLPDPTQVPEPILLFVSSKTHATPLRLLQFLALAATFSWAFPYILQWARVLTGFLCMLGRNSLNVFCIGSLLSLTGQIVRFVYTGDILVDTMLVIVGIAVMGGTAWLSEWRRSRSERERALRPERVRDE